MEKVLMAVLLCFIPDGLNNARFSRLLRMQPDLPVGGRQAGLLEGARRLRVRRGFPSISDRDPGSGCTAIATDSTSL
jgi:hypothetical protein